MSVLPSWQPFMDPPIPHIQAVDGEEHKQPQLKESQVTLLIRHLPEAITHDTLTRVLSHYGASSVRLCSGGRLRNCAFVDFRNEMLAYQAHSKLNGLRFLGKVLLVERAGKSTSNNEEQSEPQILRDSKPPTPSVMDCYGLKVLNKGSQSGSLPPSEPVAPRLGVDYPFPPYLEYAYPPPDGNILTNIVNTLIAVPRFYTQVLHLMNKMNLPAPFCMALPTPPLPPSVPEPKQPVLPPLPPPPPASVALKPKQTDLSSEESEIESSDEEDDWNTDSTAAAVGEPARKRVKHNSIVGPAINKEVAHEAVGVKPSMLVPKEIPVIKKRNPILQIKIAPKIAQHELKEDSMPKETEEAETEAQDPRKILTLEEIERGRLPLEEILSLPMFKNYAAGNPTSKLYIKNLAKDVSADDFYFIFGSLFGNIDAARSGLNVNLMQEGRMRGQAFVTFPSVELAHHALNLVNGYVFKGKPIIIQFGRK